MLAKVVFCAALAYWFDGRFFYYFILVMLEVTCNPKAMKMQLLRFRILRFQLIAPCAMSPSGCSSDFRLLSFRNVLKASSGSV